MLSMLTVVKIMACLMTLLSLLRLLCTAGPDPAGKSCGGSAPRYPGWLGLWSVGHHLHCAECQGCAFEGRDHSG